MSRTARLTVACVAGIMTLLPAVSVVPAYAQQFRYMTCDELWYERNLIYADKGYCFQTQRARSVFGPRCYPPYGRLNRAESSTVAAIQSWERRKGCPR